MVTLPGPTVAEMAAVLADEWEALSQYAAPSRLDVIAGAATYAPDHSAAVALTAIALLACRVVGEEEK